MSVVWIVKNVFAMVFCLPAAVFSVQAFMAGDPGAMYEYKLNVFLLRIPQKDLRVLRLQGDLESLAVRSVRTASARFLQ